LAKTENEIVICSINQRFRDKKWQRSKRHITVKIAELSIRSGTDSAKIVENGILWLKKLIEKSASKNYSGEKKQHIINIIEVNAQEEPRIATPSDVKSCSGRWYCIRFCYLNWR
jgi:hypothetical protein